VNSLLSHDPLTPTPSGVGKHSRKRHPRTFDPTPTDVPAPHAAGGRDVHVTNLAITYKRGQRSVTPVRDFTLFAPASRITALVGRSGSGKTSILSCIAGMLRPESGTVWLGGIEVTRLASTALDDYRRKHVGVVHQAYNLIASLSARDNVAVPLAFAGVGRKRALEIATDHLQGLGLGDVLHCRPNELSGGQQQRVAVARALSTGPSVVLADEPTAHLDGSSVNDVCALLTMMAEQNRTVIVSTHDDRLLRVADQIVHLGNE
jgi:putative ABC transport system ATP-binding protein